MRIQKRVLDGLYEQLWERVCEKEYPGVEILNDEQVGEVTKMIEETGKEVFLEMLIENIDNWEGADISNWKEEDIREHDLILRVANGLLGEFN